MYFFSYSEKHKNKMKYSSFVASKYTFVQAKLVIAQYSDEDCNNGPVQGKLWCSW